MKSRGQLPLIVGIVVLFVLLLGGTYAVSQAQKSDRPRTTPGVESLQAPESSSDPSAPALPNGAQGVDSILFVGDSWTYGTDATPLTNGFAYVIGRQLRVPVEVHGFGSVGYLNPGQDKGGTFAQRWAQIAPTNPNPSLIVLQGSQNDLDQQGNLADAVRSFAQRLRSQFPNSKLVIMGPAPATVGLINRLQPIDVTESQVAGQLQVPYISPLRQGWFTPGNIPQTMTTTSPHPNNNGHEYIATRLVRSLFGGPST